MKILNFMQYSGLNVFSLREYRYFWIAAATSNIGYWSLTYGRMWLMHDLTDSPVWVGAVATVAQAPVFLFSVMKNSISFSTNSDINFMLSSWKRYFSKMCICTTCK